ncbi:MAG: ATP-binding cassette domain-containing protein [Pyrobaculum sp.]
MISARGLGKRYGDRWVFRGASFDLDGRPAAFVGPNGSGKTTLLKILSLLLEPSEGELYLFGMSRQEAAERLRGRVLYAHQEPVVFRGTVRDNVALCGDVDWEVVEALGLTPVLDQKAHLLSSGWKKLVTVARAAACRPRAAFFDEPTAFLDKEKREAVLAVLDMLWRRGVAVAWSTHYPPEADKAAVAYEVIDGVVKKLR